MFHPKSQIPLFAVRGLTSARGPFLVAEYHGPQKVNLSIVGRIVYTPKRLKAIS